MASGRILKTQISLSEQVNDLSLRAALLFTWAIPHADDFGRLPGSSRKVKAMIVPMRDDYTASDVEACLHELHERGLIIRYRVGGEWYIQFPRWEEHQQGLHKRTRSKLPSPDQAESEIPAGEEKNLPGNSGKFPASRAYAEQNRTGTEQEQNGTGNTTAGAAPAGEDGTDSAPIPDEPQELEIPDIHTKPGTEYPEEFEAVWAVYPKRDGDNPKGRAFKAWNARRKEGHAAAEIQAGVIRYRDWLAAKGKLGTELVKQAATFFGPDKSFLQPWTATVTTKPTIEDRNRANAAEAKRLLFGNPPAERVIDGEVIRG